MRVLFYGTPEFAVPTLMALVGEGFDVVGVVTRPDRPTGRHRSTSSPSPVKVAALEEEIPVFEPAKPSDPDFMAQVRALAPDVAVVAAYGHILKQELLEIPLRGSYNVHASLLPKLRGAAPIERAILEGHDETGICIMRMEVGLDTGPVVHSVSTPISGDETGGELRLRLAEMGAAALIAALTLLDDQSTLPQPQDNTAATYAAKLTREEERIDWTEPATAVARKIRAFDPKPGAWTEINGKSVKLFGAREATGGRRSSEQEGGRREPATAETGGGRRAEDSVADTPVVIPGTVLIAGEKLIIACGMGAVAVTDVQPAGKARMTAAAFVNGRGVAEGAVLT